MTVWFKLDAFRFTRGKPKTYMTSEILERSFCSECGTSLMHRYLVRPLLTLSSVPDVERWLEACLARLAYRRVLARAR